MTNSSASEPVILKQINISTGVEKTRKIKTQKVNRVYQVHIDGVLYTGQPEINGKPIRAVRKGKALILQSLADAPPLLEVADFFPEMGATGDGAQYLNGEQLQSIFGTGSLLPPVGMDQAALQNPESPSFMVNLQAMSESQGGQVFMQSSQAVTVPDDMSVMPEGAIGAVAGLGVAAGAAGGGGGGGGTASNPGG